MRRSVLAGVLAALAVIVLTVSIGASYTGLFYSVDFNKSADDAAAGKWRPVGHVDVLIGERSDLPA